MREFIGNLPLVVKAYAWARAMGADGIRDAAELSVLANEYMEERLLRSAGSRSATRRSRRAGWR